MKLINGKEISQNLYSDLKKEIESFSSKPKLGIILANNDEASQRYVRIKLDIASDLGIETYLKTFSEEELNSHESLKREIIQTIDDLNSDSSVNGYLIQLPLHRSIRNDTNEIVNLIDPRKDVDGLTAASLGRVSHLDTQSFIPATVEGILECINQTLNKRVDWLDNNTETELNQKEIVIINNSNLIGKPLSNILMSKNATVSVLNKNTRDIKRFTQSADIVITATGKGQFLDYTYFKQGSTVIDITSKKIDGKTKGDVIPSEELVSRVEYFTPVPGGVGPLTVAFLMKNLVKAYKLQSF